MKYAGKDVLPYTMHMDGNRTFARVECEGCGGKCDINMSKPLPSEIVIKKFHERGFIQRGGTDRFKCSSCQTRSEKQQRKSQMANNLTPSRIQVSCGLRLAQVKENRYLNTTIPLTALKMLNNPKHVHLRMTTDGRLNYVFTNQPNTQTAPVVYPKEGKTNQQAIVNYNVNRLNFKLPEGVCKVIRFDCQCLISSHAIETVKKVGDVMQAFTVAVAEYVNASVEDADAAPSVAAIAPTVPQAASPKPLSQPVPAPATTPSDEESWSLQQGTELRESMNQWFETAIKKGYDVQVSLNGKFTGTGKGKKKVPTISISCNLNI